MSELGTDYSMSVPDAEWLSGTVCLPLGIRRLSLARFAEQFGTAALVEAFAQFIGLSSSVVANGADMCSMQRIIDGSEHPDRHEDRVNMPTPFGALQGVLLASKANSINACGTCAFRLGSIANQSPITTCDADWCGHLGESAFMCHEDCDDAGEPTKACAGWAQLRVERKAA